MPHVRICSIFCDTYDLSLHQAKSFGSTLLCSEPRSLNATSHLILSSRSPSTWFICLGAISKSASTKWRFLSPQPWSLAKGWMSRQNPMKSKTVKDERRWMKDRNQEHIKYVNYYIGMGPLGAASDRTQKSYYLHQRK